MHYISCLHHHRESSFAVAFLQDTLYPVIIFVEEMSY